MEFEISESIGASFAQITAALKNPDYYAHLATLGSKNVSPPELLEVKEDNGSLKLEVRYAFAGTVSGAAAMAIDVEKLTWVIMTDLDLAAKSAALDVLPDHYGDLLTCDAAVSFAESENGTVETFDGTLKVHVPFFGSTVEEAILKGLQAHVAMEAAALTSFCTP